MSDNWKSKFPANNIYFELDNGLLYNGDALSVLREFPDGVIDCVITSPPYWALRDYGVDGQIGVEQTFNKYLEKLWSVFDEVYRVLKNTGTLWVNLGDTYYGGGKGKTNGKNKAGSLNGERFRMMKYPKKTLLLIPERFAIGMIERGWILRNKIIWHKPNAMPQSVKDRFTVDFEFVYFFVKRQKYYFKQILEPYKTTPNYRRKNHKYRDSGLISYRENLDFYTQGGRNKRTVWSISTKPFKDAHFAVFPPELVEIPIISGCPGGGVVLDPFVGSGTVLVVSQKYNRNWVGIDVSQKYCDMIKNRLGW